MPLLHITVNIVRFVCVFESILKHCKNLVLVLSQEIPLEHLFAVDKSLDQEYFLWLKRSVQFFVLWEKFLQQMRSTTTLHTLKITAVVLKVLIDWAPKLNIWWQVWCTRFTHTAWETSRYVTTFIFGKCQMCWLLLCCLSILMQLSGSWSESLNLPTYLHELERSWRTAGYQTVV